MSAPRVALGLLISLFLVSACAPKGERADAPVDDASGRELERAFVAQYAPYCDAMYEGRSVMVELGDDHPLDGARLRMILERCIDHEVRMPFRVDDDHSRTWILTRDHRGLRLAHDHRYEDGTEHDANFYGGYADADRGSATRQYFPADDRTIGDRPARTINVWSKEFDLENERYYYRLYLRGELRYEAEFDLSRPLPVPESE